MTQVARGVRKASRKIVRGGGRFRKRTRMGIVKDGVRNFARGAMHLANPVNRLRMAANIGRTGYRMVTTKRTSKVPDNVRQHARFAEASYTPGHQRPKEIHGAVLNTELSSPTLAVYTHPETNKHHVSIRGTDPTHVADLVDDIGIMHRNPRNKGYRMREIDHTIRQLGSNPDNITLYGHSLGGALADAASSQYGIQSHNFNAGTSPVERAHSDLSHNYLIAGDPISMFGLGQMEKGSYTLYNKQNSGSRHSLDQFL